MDCKCCLYWLLSHNIYQIVQSQKEYQRFIIIQHHGLIYIFKRITSILMDNPETTEYAGRKKKVQIIGLESNDSVCYLLGPTGSGKSTLVNFLLGKQIITKKKQFVQYQLETADGTGARIGNSMGSCTTMPTMFEDRDSELKFMDNPGFNDTKGTKANLNNAYALSQLFRKGNKVKLVLVLEVDSLSDARGDNFIQTINMVAKSFERMILPSCILVISKVNGDTKQDVEKQIEKLLRDRQFYGSFFVSGLIRTKNMFIFPTPKYMGDEIYVIKNKLSNMPPYLVSKDIQIQLDANTKYEVQKLKINVNRNFEVLAKDFNQAVERKFTSIPTESLPQKIEHLKAAKIHIQQVVRQPATLKQVFEKMKIISTELQLPKDLTNRFNQNFKQIEVCKSIRKDMVFGEGQNLPEKFLSSIDIYLKNLQIQQQKHQHQLQMYRERMRLDDLEAEQQHRLKMEALKVKDEIDSKAQNTLSENKEMLMQQSVQMYGHNYQRMQSIQKLNNQMNELEERQSSMMKSETNNTFMKLMNSSNQIKNKYIEKCCLHSRQKTRLMNQTLEDAEEWGRYTVVFIDKKCVIM